MRSTFAIVALILAASIFPALTSKLTSTGPMPQSPHPIWPAPSTYTTGSVNLTISNPCGFTFVLTSNNSVPQIAEMTALYQNYIFGCDNSRTKEEILINHDDLALPDADNNVLYISIADTSNILVNISTDESYTLSVSSTSFSLNANTYAGFIRGLETFSQLVFTPAINNVTSYFIPSTPVNIHDVPRFPHRGVGVDTSRHYIPVSVILQIMDAMLATKLNVLHWHITDSDSFPIYLPSHPNLTIYGAFSPEETYSQSDVEEIVDYAIARGIIIIPEIDSPAHVTSWALAPEAASLINCSQEVWYQGIPVGQINPTLNATYELVGDIIQDLENYFPWQYLHLGADEVFQWCWNNTEIINWQNEHNMNNWTDLFNYYLQQVRGLKNPSTTGIYWGSNATEYLEFESDDVIQYWGDSSDLQQFINSYPNNKVILSDYESLYLDCGLGNYLGENCFCGPFPTWVQVYQWDPINFVEPKDMSRIIGAEAVEWSELNNNVNILTKIFPRAASLAETLWSPYKNPYNNILSVFVRLNTWRNRVMQRGVYTMPISAEYCELNPATCFG